MDIKITAVLKHLPLNTSCDHTGKLKTEEELKRQGNSPYRGKVLIAISAGQTKIVSFYVIILEGKSELYCKLEQVQSLNGTRDAFELEEALKELCFKTALRVLRNGIPQEVTV